MHDYYSSAKLAGECDNNIEADDLPDDIERQTWLAEETDNFINERGND